MNAGVICGARVSHDRASVDEIEAAAGEDVRAVLEELLERDGVSEAFALQTCNRAEVYVVAANVDGGHRALDSVMSSVRDDVVIEMGHEESLRHLMRVAAGLESLVIGEDQIIGQFKRAVETARGVGALGPTLETGLTKAVHVGERARTETRINEGAVSIGSAAARLAEREAGLDGSTALVVGAGEMGTLAAAALADAGVERLVVANRTVPHAEHVATSVDTEAQAVSLDALADALGDASVVVTATSRPDYLLDPTDVVDAGETLVIDLAQPRDVHPEASAVEGVAVHDIDALESVTAETRASRKAAAREVEEMIDAEFDRLLDAYKRRQADAAISTMYEAAERVKDREVDTALSRLDARGELTDEEREIVESMADALVGQLLSAPTKSLREAAAEDDWSTIQTAMALFDPAFDRGGRAKGHLDALGGPEDATGIARDGNEQAAEERTGGRELPQYVLESVSDD
ncbi:glutamyl-tRNA reductase [Halobellus sp. GM3]|uniref:glutamyl-tRNA reductase n=1 Tax=Halobellus sp. GM3 TaxID=3458410 RepID=UPI00403E031C